ncbi:MAG: DUF6088 family protein [Clostridiaceae bacterium]|nr:DUF6088 family protein [Clostridiaceae bacterium]
MEHRTYVEFITNKIADIPYGQAFQTDVIAEAMAEEYKVSVHKAKPITNVTLKRLVDKGVIERFQKGVYYRVKQTAFGQVRPSEDILEAQLLTRRGDEIIGYETGLSLMNKIGLTTLVPKKREIATNAYRKNISDRYTIVRKPVTTVNAGNFCYLQLLDVIRDMRSASVDAVNPEAILHNFINKFSLDPVVALTYARRYYSKKTLLFLVDLLVGQYSKNPQFAGDLWYNNTVEGVGCMSPELHSRRLAAVKLANAVNKIEGVPVSTQAKTLSAKWVRGEISGAEMKAALIAKHKQV